MVLLEINFTLYIYKMYMIDGWKKKTYLDRQPYFQKMKWLLIYETEIHYIDVFRYLLLKLMPKPICATFNCKKRFMIVVVNEEKLLLIHIKNN